MSSFGALNRTAWPWVSGFDVQYSISKVQSRPQTFIQAGVLVMTHQ